MPRIYLPSRGAEDWQRLLGDPEKHWRSGYSAKTLAHAWEDASHLPTEIATILAPLGEPELLVAIPEHQVALPGTSIGKSQNDLFALVRLADKTGAMTIEGKVNEPFDQTLGKWLANASAGKRERLAFLCDMLGLAQPLPDTLHYQLLHRTASAIIEARRFKTDVAIMLIHSFSPEKMWFEAFAHFTSLFGLTAEPNVLLNISPKNTLPIYVGWACGNGAYLTR